MTHTEDGAGASKPVPLRSHSNFAARTARDEAEQLDRHSSVFPSPSPNEETPLLNVEHQQRNPNSPHHVRPSEEEGRTFSSVRNWLPNTFRSRSQPARGGGGSVDVAKPRPGAFPRPVGGTRKLGTFAGVFVPTTLNVLSILMFLRFGFILGQAGLVGMLGTWTRPTAQSSVDAG
jgi:potassium/chloride transporter 9